MKKLLLGAVASILSMSGLAAAQGNTLNAAPVVEGFDLDRLDAILRAAQFQTSRATENGQTFTVAVAQNGSKFLVIPDACDDQIQLRGCKAVEITAFFSNTPVPLQTLNAFHGSKSTGTIAIAAPGNVLVSSRKVFALGGVREAHFAAHGALFFNDMGNLAQMVQEASRLVRHDDGAPQALAAEAFPPLMSASAPAPATAPATVPDPSADLPLGYATMTEFGIAPLSGAFAAPSLGTLLEGLE